MARPIIIYDTSTESIRSIRARIYELVRYQDEAEMQLRRPTACNKKQVSEAIKKIFKVVHEGRGPSPKKKAKQFFLNS